MDPFNFLEDDPFSSTHLHPSTKTTRTHPDLKPRVQHKHVPKQEKGVFFSGSDVWTGITLSFSIKNSRTFLSKQSLQSAPSKTYADETHSHQVILWANITYSWANKTAIHVTRLDFLNQALCSINPPTHITAFKLTVVLRQTQITCSRCCRLCKESRNEKLQSCLTELCICIHLQDFIRKMWESLVSLSFVGLR